MISFFISLFLISHAYAAAPVIGDFKTKIYHGDSAHAGLWAIEVTPPAGHHLNLEAPHSVQSQVFKFELVKETPQEMLFQIAQPLIRTGSVAELSIFVCDEKKTYCLKKTMSVSLDEKNASTIKEKFSSKKGMKTTVTPVTPKKREDIFIDNNPTRAIAEAKLTQKPLLIDFYGIWCPPCNLYNETIFNTKEFEAQAKKYVLLKMDADDEKSWELKSKFKIGGYPTLLIAHVGEDGFLEEIERIVGYFPPQEFYSRLNLAYQHRNDIPEFRWKGRLEERILSNLEQKNYDQVIKLSLANQEGKYQLYRWIAECKKNDSFIKDLKNLDQVKATLDSLGGSISTLSSDLLASGVDFLNDEIWLKQERYFKMANEFIDQLYKRIDPSTLFVKGSELTAADLDSLKMDLAETLHQENLLSELRKKTIKSYEKLIGFFASQGHHDLRSMNLEYAYLLWKDGRTEEAKKLYSQFIKKYPEEFTFYFAASKMYLSLKELSQAREMAEQALSFSYGDNKLRAMDRLINIMVEQGQKSEAILKGKEFLKTVKAPQDINVRTGRYIDSLKATLAKIEKLNEVKK